MIDQNLLAYLQALNTPAGSRVFIETVEEGVTRPFIVIRRTGGARPLTTGGAALFPRSEFEVNVFADDHAASYPIEQALVQALHGFKGMMGTTRVHGTRCTLFPDHTSEVDGDLRTRWVTLAFRFLHSEG
jgi:hypothetical protein